VRLNRAGGILAVVMLALPAAASEVSAGRQLYAEPSPLATLIDELPGMPAEARLEFAAVLLDGLLAAYETELDQAMAEDQRRGAGQRELLRWSQAIAQILDELRAWQADLYVAEQVEVRVDPHNQVILMIDGRPLWIAWPRITAGSRLERELAAEFCRRQECPGKVLEGAGAHAEAPSGAPGSWVISQFKPPSWQGPDGVQCEFSDASRLSEKERVCQDVVADLHVLAAALRAAWQAGEHISWPHVALRAGTVGGQHLIAVSARGDYIAVYVPALAAQPVDWPEAARWLQAQLEGTSATATVLRAAGGR
jgi:hypothetical protein